MNLRLLGLTGLAMVGFLASETPATTAAPAAVCQPAPLDARSLRGTHGFTYSGSHVTLGAIASSGRITFDGRGTLDAVFTTSVGGTAFTGTFAGTYRVNHDGTGSIVIDLPWLNTQGHGDFVVVDRGEGTFFTSTDAGYSVTGRTHRM